MLYNERNDKVQKHACMITNTMARIHKPRIKHSMDDDRSYISLEWSILWRTNPDAPQNVLILWRTRPYAPQNVLILWRITSSAPQN
jgi:hypothetical protein